MINNIEIEKSLLGAMILEPNYVPDVMATIAKTNPFTDPANTAVFDEIRKLYHRGDAIDLLTLTSQPSLRDRIPYVTELTQFVSHGSNSVHYARILCELTMRRQLQTISAELSAKAGSADDVGEVIKWAQRSIDSTLGIITDSTAPHHVSEVMDETIDEIEARAKAYNNGEIVGVMSGLSEFDKATGGFRGGQLIVLAGRPAMGKSAIMLHLAREAAERGTPTIIFSLEMQRREVGERMILSQGKYNNNGIKIGKITNEEWDEIERSNSQIRNLPIHISDNPNLTIQTIKAQCQRHKARGKCGLVVIDYLQLLDSILDKRSVTREREISEMTRQAKVMASELDIPVILLSQLNRRADDRPDRIPQLNDLRESGAIEQDADIVIFVNRPAEYGQKMIDTETHGSISSEGVGYLYIAKQRNGRTCFCLFRHSPDLNHITDYDDLRLEMN